MVVDFTSTAGLPSWITASGAANGTRFNSSGLLVAATTPRLDYDPATLLVIGTLTEPAATNILLQNRDLTQAAWVKDANTTAALNQTGLDGSANSASSLTATGPNAVTCQSVTLASSVRQLSAYVKRITGAGNIQMATDATDTAGTGATWTTITAGAALTNRVTIPTQTVTNPITCLRIVTSGDAIAVDAIQNETTNITSPILTTAAAVTRTQDIIQGTVVGAKINTIQGTACASVKFRFSPQAGKFVFQGVNSKGGVIRSNVMSGLVAPNPMSTGGTFNISSNVLTNLCVSYGGSQPNGSFNGTRVLLNTVGAAAAWQTTIEFGTNSSSSSMTGWLVGFKDFNGQISPGRLNAITFVHP